MRLTRRDVELRRYTQNDGSAQPRRVVDHLTVPTGVNRQLLADPVGRGWDHMRSQRATLATSFGSAVRPLRQAYRLLHGTRGRAARLDHYN